MAIQTADDTGHADGLNVDFGVAELLLMFALQLARC